MAMEDLLPHYERELAFLRRYSREFADQYPKIAGRLLMSDDVAEDPHVERLIESFAFLGARISKKLEDDYPEFTDALLEVLYPHYLRPFPACSIARFDLGKDAAKLTSPVLIPRGTELLSRRVRGVVCRFRTCYDVTLAPVRIAEAKFDALINAPEAVRLPAGAESLLSLRFDLLDEKSTGAGLKTLRVFADGEPSLCAALRDTLSMRIVRAYVQPADTDVWTALEEVPVHAVGYTESESLFDYPARSHPAYRLLTEYFAFPEKFGFFDLDFGAMHKAAGRHGFTLHLAVSGLAVGSSAAHMLESLSADNFRLGCTPIVNLFQRRGEPIRVSQTQVSYPVLADAQMAFAYEVHSIDTVKRVRQTAQGEEITEFRPFYSLRHGETTDQSEHYWIATRNELLGDRSPGYGLELSLVDLDFNPVVPHTDVLGLELSCTNRDLPASLAYGVAGGDLTMEGGGVVRVISLLRKPTAPLRFRTGRGSQWRLISHLSLNHLSLSDNGPAVLQEMLRLYDLPQSATSGRQIDGIVALEQRVAMAWLQGQRFASMVRGVEIRLTIDEDNFVGAGISTFAQVLDRFFGLYVHVNSFIQLVLLSKRNGEVLIKCPPRSGDSILA